MTADTAIAKIGERPAHVGEPLDPARFAHPSLIWLDLETTGLDEQNDEILEIAIIVTGADLVPIDRFHYVTGRGAYVRPVDVDPFVVEMHDANGLWAESMAVHVDNRARKLADEYAWLDNQLELFMCATVGGRSPNSRDRPKLAGSSVHFDLGFLRRRLPLLTRMLSHRTYDVSALNEHALRHAPAAYEGRPRDGGTAHRAMSDIEHSLAVARHYAATLVGPAPAPPARVELDVDEQMAAGHA